jgi:hypothetical protein
MNIRFVISWLVSAVIMYSAFYCWHAILSNDFYKIQYPKGIFLILAALVYIVISFVLAKIFDYKPIRKKIKNLFLRAIVLGSLLGLLLFSISIVLGIGFSASYSIQIFVLDALWQLFEQILGCFVIALTHVFIFIPEFEEERA